MPPASRTPRSGSTTQSSSPSETSGPAHSLCAHLARHDAIAFRTVPAALTLGLLGNALLQRAAMAATRKVSISTVAAAPLEALTCLAMSPRRVAPDAPRLPPPRPPAFLRLCGLRRAEPLRPPLPSDVDRERAHLTHPVLGNSVGVCASRVRACSLLLLIYQELNPILSRSLTSRRPRVTLLVILVYYGVYGRVE
jgi:hypothetical protein